jgi:hypothetical protein
MVGFDGMQKTELTLFCHPIPFTLISFEVQLYDRTYFKYINIIKED